MAKLGSLIHGVDETKPYIEDGTYPAVVTAKEVLSKGSRIPSIQLITEFEGGDKVLTDTFALYTKEGDLNEASVRRLKKRLRPIMGDRVDAEDFDSSEVDRINAMATVKQESWQDDDGEEQTSPRVKRYLHA